MTQFTNVAPQVSFGEAIGICFKKYADFTGRARRSEYWWFTLFQFMVGIVLGWIPFLGQIVALAFLLPSLAVAARRLHDIGKSGLWLLAPYGCIIVTVIFLMVGMLGYRGDYSHFSGSMMIVSCIFVLASLVFSIILLIWCVTDSKPEENEYGPSPKYGGNEEIYV